MLPNKQTKLNTAIWLTVVALAVLSWPAAATAQDVNDFNVPDFNLPDDPNLEAELQMSGTIEGTGPYFEVTDSNYLNITFESSEPVNLRLESVPEMVVMDIEAAEGANSTQITLTGFEPSTTYYKYQDDYHNEVTFTTDLNGSYAYPQDLCEPHIVFIQPSRSTLFLSDSGWSDPTVGTWNPLTKTAKLIQDVYETIQIDSDGITLDGDGFRVVGSGTGNGVYLNHRSSVTITNLTVEGFSCGIYLYNSCQYNTLTGNTVSNNSYGIQLNYSSNNTIMVSTVTGNWYGIRLLGCSNSTLTGNTVDNNRYGGISLSNSSNSTLTGNTASYSWGGGISLYRSGGSTLTNNTANSNGENGMFLLVSGGSTLSGNTMSGNWYNFGVDGTEDSDFDNTIDTTNTVDSKPVYYVKNITGTANEPVVYDSSTNAGVFYAINCNYITIKDLMLTKNYHGILFWRTQNSTIENVSVSDNQYYGILSRYSDNNTLISNNCSPNRVYGIYLLSCSSNTLTGNTVSNSLFGIHLIKCSYSTLTGNKASSNNQSGIYLDSSSYSTLTDNTASSNGWCGIGIYHSSGSMLRGNLMSGNKYNFYVDGYWYSHDIDTTNTVDGEPVYYVKNDVGGVYDASTNAGVFYAINCDNITIRGLTLTNNWDGIFLRDTQNSTIENVSASNNLYGIRLEFSSNNTVTCNTTSNNYHGLYMLWGCTDNILNCNTVSSNRYNGIFLSSYCNNNTLTNNTIPSNNRYGIYLASCSYNNIYNNNFMYNGTQAFVSGGSGNVFNLSELEGGGNYWNNWTSPDVDPEDGFVDSPYVFTGGQDNLPLVSQVICVCNQPPVADAGTDQSVHPGEVVTLDGSASTDPDENYPLSYSWQITSMPEGSMTELWDFETVNPTFIPDLMGDYTIELVVTDSLGAQSAPDSVLVSTYNTPPVADAGSDQALIVLGTVVQLDGTQSWDEDGDEITYLWTIIQKPAESLAELSDPCSSEPNFVADVQGDYVISLIVTDIFDAVSEPDTLAVSFMNVKPVADAGGSQAAIVGETVFLDGSDSNDENGDPLTYSWSFVSKPVDSIADFDDCNSVQPSFVADHVGTFIVSLVVNDGFVDSEPANVTIEVISCVDAGTQTLLDLIEVINNLPQESLKNRNMKTPLINKINAVLGKIENGIYEEAVDKLQNDILGKTNGCAEIGQPDKNDWLIACEAQDQVYPLIMSAITFLANPDGTCF